MKKKQIIWTKRCSDGRTCAPFDQKALNKLNKKEQEKERKKGYPYVRNFSLTFFIPDEYDVCDSCLLAIYNLKANLTSGGCSCCAESGFYQDDVVKALRQARKEIK